MRRWFLSYHAPDQGLAERLKSAIERKDSASRVFFAPSHLRAGGTWSAQLAQEIADATAFILLIGEAGIGKWQVPEYDEALDKWVKSPAEFPLIVVLLEGQTAPGLPFLRLLHWIITPDPVSEKDIARLFDATSGGVSNPGELWRFTSPYRGLEAMGEKDSDYFLGRKTETVDVLSALASAPDRLPVLIGNSGVGKSSLAQAGVLAALKRQAWPEEAGGPSAWPAAFQDSRQWCFLSLKPGSDPLKAVVESFIDTWQFAATDPERVKHQHGWIELLGEGKATLPDLIEATERRRKELDQPKPPRFFLYVDQGEELYVRAEGRQRQRFSELLADALRDSRLRAMMSMRSDFLGYLQNDKPLFNARQQIDVAPLREAELHEIVSRPAQLLGAQFETEGLIDIITRRTAEDSVKVVGALPLLSYTLDDMWTQMVHRGDGTLRLPTQSFELGGVLVDRANTFLGTHPGAEAALRRVLTLRCATVREDGEPTRRRAAREEFSPDEWRLVSELADYPNRLLVTVATESGETYAEVAHEVIFRRWDKLREWIAAEREFLAWRSGLEASRRAWQATPDASKHDALLMGLALAQAQSWFTKRSEDLPRVDREFIDLSMRRDTLERQRRETLRRRMFGGAIAALIVVSMLALFSFFQWREAFRQQQVAQQERDRAEHAIATFVYRLLSAGSGTLQDLDQAIKLDPTDAANYFLRAMLDFQSNDQDGAVTDLSRAIALDPRFIAAYVIRGLTYGSKKEYDRAIADYDQAIKLDPKDARTYDYRGNIYYNKQDYDRAIADYDQAIKLNPTLALAFNHRGNAYYAKKDFDRAIADYDQAIRLNPTYADAYNNRGNSYSEKKDYDRAIADYDQAIAINPNLTSSYDSRGSSYYEKKEYGRAIADYDQVIKLNPNYADAYVKRAVAIIEGNVAGSLAEYDEAIRHQPGNGYLYFFRGFIRLYIDSANSAVDDLAAAVRLAPSFHYAAIWLYIARTRSGQDAGAELSEHARKLDQTIWPWPVVALFLGPLDVESVRLAARRTDNPNTQRTQGCDADFYVGVYQQLKGARNDAQRSWQSVAAGCSNIPPGYVARLELERLR